LWPLPALLTMSVAVFLSVTTELLPTGLLPAMSHDLGVTEGQLGLLVTGFALMVAVFATPLGIAVARVPRRGLLVAALFGYAACNLITALSHAYPLTVGARLVGGLTHGVFWGMLAGYAGRIVSPDRVGRAVTLVSAGGAAATLVGVPAGTAVGTAIGWRAAFVIFAVAPVAVVAVALRLLPHVPGRAPADRLPVLAVLRLPGLAPIVAVTAVTMLGHFSFYTYVAPYLLRAGVPPVAVSPALLLYGLVGLISLGLTGFVADRAPRAGLLAGSVALVGSFLVLTIAGAGVPAWLAIAGSAATALALGSLPVLLQTVILRAAPAAPEQASALNASSFNVGIGGGALLGGLALDHFGAAALPAIALALAGAGLLTLLFSRGIGAPTVEPATAAVSTGTVATTAAGTH
jgi:predicted MFS family arabinose efflux permease